MNYILKICGCRGEIMKDDSEKIKDIMKEAEELAEDWEGGYFNYRLVEKEDRWTGLDGKEKIEYYYEIHEVYYNGKDEIIAWSENPMHLYFETDYDIKEEIKHIKRASKAKILKLIKNENGDDSLIELDKYIKDIK